jgi:hypothetical protein
MIQFEMTPEEKEILVQLLESCLSDLHDEISHTDNYDYREMLKHRRQVLQKLSDALQDTGQTISGD